MPVWLVAGLALAYASFLYFIAHHADRRALIGMMTGPRPYTYALGLAVFCTSWTFYGSVGMAATRGLDFLTVYAGPILVFLLGYPLLKRIVTIGRNERTSSTADFIAARYGKNYGVALVATIICVVGIIPYIALQLQAVANSFDLLTNGVTAHTAAASTRSHEATVALPIALALGVFAILFGTRHADATEHQDGMFVAIAFESIVKFAAFVAVGTYALFLQGESAGDVVQWVGGDNAGVLARTSSLDTLLTLTLLSGLAILLLPREFHMMVVENRDLSELRAARWFFPAYLVGINLFVLPVAYAGLKEVGTLTAPDLYVIAVPLMRDSPSMAAIAFIGGLSAATAMVIVACVALAIMISNHIVLPYFISRQQHETADEFGDWGGLILQVRRAAIICVMLLAYLYYQASIQTQQLSQIGFLSFAAVAQLAPAFLGGLFWRNANARGAQCAMITGFGAWFVLLLLPTLTATPPIVTAEFVGAVVAAGLAEPAQAEALTGIDPFVSGTLISLALNFLAFVGGSLSRKPTPFERVQASVFIPDASANSGVMAFTRMRVTVGELRATISSYLGLEATTTSFEEYFRKQGIDPRADQLADGNLVRFAEQLLGRAVGSASARLILSLLTERRNAESPKTIQLLGEASEALQHNRGQLQTALDQVAQGICVFDADLRLTFWNRRMFELMDLPDRLQQVGTPLRDLTDAMIRADFLPQREAKTVLAKLSQPGARVRVEHSGNGRVIEIQTSPMPSAGLVATISDVTEAVRTADVLRRANEELEHRVATRTEELLSANEELARARMRADQANAGKTRFLAAAGHDILQPLNAARLYCAALLEGERSGPQSPALNNIDAALGSVETILSAVLEISKLDAGAMRARIAPFPAGKLLDSLRTDFAPAAAAKGLKLTVLPSSLLLNSDRDLLRRLVQNLVSNAIKYTRNGGVVVGIRRRGHEAVIEVVDSGIGMADADQTKAFQEFTRLDAGAREAGGLGLGLSIVERIAGVLGLSVQLRSVAGKGTRVSIIVPCATAQASAMAEPEHAPVAELRVTAGALVLCVDNDASILAGLEMLLSRWNCRPVTAMSGAEALTKLEALRETPDVALVDFHLAPDGGSDGETGLDVIALLRERFGTGLRACLVTADRGTQLARTAMDRDIDLLNKPVKPAALRAIINDAAPQRQAAE
ncbi:MAG: PAS-domain containing protein [Rhizobiaceae bacterium]|jgi:Na+/proline symporter/CheY-like chemotaxis protein/anti-sigma regulatory factor (Ser/Thr protein kinase)|nr:PAS-domain containing protein [Rhizobiaceae bacterium]